MKTKIFLFAVLVFVCASVVANPAKAIEYGQIGGRPANPDPNIPDSKSWFIYHLEPGQSKEDALEVVNLFQDPWDALIYAADSVKSSSGGFALKQFSEDKNEVGSWVRFYPDPAPDFTDALFSGGNSIFEACAVDRETLAGKVYKFTDQQISDFSDWCKGKNSLVLTLAGGEKKQVPFVISIPQNAEVGEHTGGILIQKQNKDEATQENGSRVLLTTRVGVRIYETVPGEIVKDLQFSGFSIKKNFDEFFLPWDKEKKDKFGEYVINSVAVNGGNVSTDFSEKIIIHNRFFGKDTVIDGRDFQVLRGDQFDSTLAWTAPRFGWLSIHKEYKFTDASGVEKNVSSETISLWFIPWRESTFSLILLLLLGGAYFWWKRRNVKLYGGLGWITYKTKKTDSIASLAQKYAVDWKVLVKTNKLKAPYILEAGREILVPGDAGKTIADITIRDEEEWQTPIAAAPAADPEKKKFSEKLAEIFRKIPREKTVTLVISWKNVLFAAAVVILVVAFSAAAFLANRKRERLDQNNSINSLNNCLQDAAQKKETEAAAPQQATGQAVEKTKADLIVHILNGGAKPGSAAKMKSVLENSGYGNADTGNAQGSNYAGTEVFYNDGLQKSADDLVAALKTAKMANVADAQPATSDEEKSGDLVVILGK